MGPLYSYPLYRIASRNQFRRVNASRWARRLSFGYFLHSREFPRNGADGVTNSGSCCGGAEGTFTIVMGEAIFGEFEKGWWPN